MPKYWLMKSEPGEFSIEDLRARPSRTEPWDGVRNYQARNMMRDEMKPGDQAFFYHSACEEPGIVGIVTIASEAYPDPTAVHWKDTALMARCPALADAVSRVRCTVNSARLMALGPGSLIREHRDHALGLADGAARLHLPVATGPGVTFMLAGKRVDMREGELWYLDFSQPHAVRNDGECERVHLVMDCPANDWLETVVTSSEAPGA